MCSFFCLIIEKGMGLYSVFSKKGMSMATKTKTTKNKTQTKQKTAQQVVIIEEANFCTCTSDD